MAAVHAHWAEPGLDVPCVGGAVQVRPGSLYRCAALPPFLSPRVTERGFCYFVADTMGYAFTFHVVAWLVGIPFGAYVHYPTISTDMLARVETRQTTYANSSAITSSTVRSRLKLQ